MMAMGRKMNTGSQAQNSGMNLLGSAASSFVKKCVRVQAVVRAKLFITADFIDLGSRQIRAGRLTMRVTKLMTGSVMRA